MSMFADRTYDTVLAEMLSDAPRDVDTRQGSIFYDSIAACAFKIAKFYADAACIFELVAVDTASGEYLDQKGKEFRVYRNQPTAARYNFLCAGTQPTAGTRFFSDGLYFTVSIISGALYLDAEEAGEDYNHIPSGAAATPVNTIDGLTSATFGSLHTPGTAVEGDDNYRDRIREKIGGPAQSGNKQHYKTWSEEVPGVGRARIIPLWAGENTVKSVLIDTNGSPATKTVVDRVQDYIDPGGRGLGEGKANIGAHLSAVSALPVRIDVAFTVTLARDYTPEDARTAATAAIVDYLKELALSTPDNEPIVVRISTIGVRLYALKPITDYTALTLNGIANNIAIQDTEVAQLGEVTVRANL